FDRQHAGRGAELVAPPIDDSVLPLVSAAAMPHRDPTLVVPPGLPLERLGERLLRLALGDLLEGRDAHPAPARRRRLVIPNRHPILPGTARCAAPRGGSRWPSSTSGSHPS